MGSGIDQVWSGAQDRHRPPPFEGPRMRNSVDTDGQPAGYRQPAGREIPGELPCNLAPRRGRIATADHRKLGIGQEVDITTHVQDWRGIL